MKTGHGYNHIVDAELQDGPKNVFLRLRLQLSWKSVCLAGVRPWAGSQALYKCIGEQWHTLMHTGQGHAYNSSTSKVDAGGSEMWDHLLLHSDSVRPSWTIWNLLQKHTKQAKTKTKWASPNFRLGEEVLILPFGIKPAPRSCLHMTPSPNLLSSRSAGLSSHPALRTWTDRSSESLMLLHGAHSEPAPWGLS